MLIVPDAQIELGYTNLGPIFNLNLALTTEKRDTIVDKIEIIIQHEAGEKHIFRWQGLRETISELTNTSGERVIQQKDQPAIALKLVTTSLVEKFVRFQEDKIQKELKKLSDDLFSYSDFLIKTGKELSEILNSQQFHNLMDYYKSNFWWRVGKYAIEFIINGPNKIEFKKSKYSFELHSYDIEPLNKNIEIIKLVFENILQGEIKYHITEDTLNRLKGENIPDDILAEVKPLINQVFADDTEFLNVLKSRIGNERISRFRLILLNSSRVSLNHKDLEQVYSKFYWCNIKLIK